MGARHGFAAPGLVDHICQGKARKVLAHVITDVGPDAEQDALALVIARAVLVGLAEVTPGRNTFTATLRPSINTAGWA